MASTAANSMNILVHVRPSCGTEEKCGISISPEALPDAAQLLAQGNTAEKYGQYESDGFYTAATAGVEQKHSYEMLLSRDVECAQHGKNGFLSVPKESYVPEYFVLQGINASDEKAVNVRREKNCKKASADEFKGNLGSPKLSSTLFSLEVQELNRPGVSYNLSVRWHTSVKDIKDQLHLISNSPVARMKLFYSSSAIALSNSVTLHDLGIEKAGYSMRVAFNSSNMQHSLFSSKDVETTEECAELLSQCRMGLRNQVPAKTDILDCTGGVYFLKASSGAQVAVFKPNDEEQGMQNNPKGHHGNGEVGMRPHFKPGEGYMREMAAFLLDQGNFAQVPPTTIVHCEHSSFHFPSKQVFPKLGSFQKFVRASDTFEDISPSQIGTFELQKIALLDMRLLNCDRNSSNILAIRKLVPNTFHNGIKSRRDSRSSSLGSNEGASEEREFNWLDDEAAAGSEKEKDLYELIPIDHGYCLPTKLRIEELDWAWFYCRQIEAPVDPDIKRYMRSLDLDAMVAAVRKQLSLSEDTIYLVRLAHKLLLDGINSDVLTLRDLAELIARTEESVPSALENVIKIAEENAYRVLEIRSSRGAHLDAITNSTSTEDRTSPIRPSKARSPVNFRSRAGTINSSEFEESPRLQRVVKSEVNLEALGNKNDKLLKRTPSACNADQVSLLDKSAAVPGSHEEEEDGSYLSVENIERLQQSPKFTFNYLRDGGAQSLTLPGRASDAEDVGLPMSPHRTEPVNIAPFAAADAHQIPSGITLRLSQAAAGKPLTTMQTLDSFLGGIRGSPSTAILPPRAPVCGVPTEPVSEHDLTSSEERSSTDLFNSSPGHVSGGFFVQPKPVVLLPAVLNPAHMEVDLESSSSSASPSTAPLYSRHHSNRSSLVPSFSPYTVPVGAQDFLQLQFHGSSSSNQYSSSNLEHLGDSTDTQVYRSSTPHFHTTQSSSLSPVTSGQQQAFPKGNALVLERPFPPRITPAKMIEAMHPQVDEKGVGSKGRRLKSSTPSSKSSDEKRKKKDVDSAFKNSHSDDDADNETDAEEDLLSVPKPAAAISHPFKPLGGAGLQRVASIGTLNTVGASIEQFAGKGTDRQLQVLQREKRKLMAKTAEFQELRLSFANAAIENLIAKTCRMKSGKKVHRK